MPDLQLRYGGDLLQSFRGNNGGTADSRPHGLAALPNSLAIAIGRPLASEDSLFSSQRVTKVRVINT